MRINCFLTDLELKEVKDYIEEMERDKKIDYVESGGLGVRVERAGTQRIYDIYRVIGTVSLSDKKKKKP